MSLKGTYFRTERAEARDYLRRLSDSEVRRQAEKSDNRPGSLPRLARAELRRREKTKTGLV